METVWILYVLFAGLMVVFWRHAQGRPMEALFDESHDHHAHVLRAIPKHPDGGTWTRHRAWMAETAKKKRKPKKRSIS